MNKQIEEAKKRQETRLANIRQQIRYGQALMPDAGDEHLKWMYYCLMNDIQTSLKPSSTDTIDDIDHKRGYELFRSYDSTYSNFDVWKRELCNIRGINIVPYASESRTNLCNLEKYDVYINSKADFGFFFDYHNIENFRALKCVYEYHNHIIQSYHDAQRISIDAIYEFLGEEDKPGKSKTLIASGQIKDLQKVVAELPQPPAVTLEEAQQEAEAVSPDNYESVHAYASDIGIDLREAVAVVARFAAASCPTPHATLDVIDHIEGIRTTINPEDLDTLSQRQEGFAGRMFNRVRPAPYQQTPLFKMAEAAQSLPDAAKEDAVRHAGHIKVLQKGLEIIHGYDESLRYYIQALEDRKIQLDKETASKPVDDPETLTTRDIADGILSDVVDDKLTALKTSQAFAKAHAANFAKLLRPVMKAQAQSEGMSGLAANIFLPMQQIQRAFMAYQAQKFGAVASQVNDVLADSTADNTPMSGEKAKDVLTESMQTLTLMLERMKAELGDSLSDITDIAKRTEQAAATGEADVLRPKQT